MSKRKRFIILVALLLVSSNIFILVKLYNDNHSLRDQQGIIIHNNILNISGTVSDARKDLPCKNSSKQYRYYWQFNEFTKLDLPFSIMAYSTNIRNEYNELIKLSEGNSSQEEINKKNNDLELHLSKFQTALALIMKECSGTDYIKFYSLYSEGNTNTTMKSVMKILTEDVTGSTSKK